MLLVLPTFFFVFSPDLTPLSSIYPAVPPKERKKERKKELPPSSVRASGVGDGGWGPCTPAPHGVFSYLIYYTVILFSF